MTYNSSFTGAQVDESVTKTQAAGTILLGTGNTPIQPNATQFIVGEGVNERLRIDSSGNVLVGITSPTGAASNTLQGITLSPSYTWFASNDAMYLQRPNNTDGTFIEFFKGANSVGRISVTGSTTNYITSSDQRLKENITDAASSAAKIDALQVRKFDWKADGNHQEYGLIAQELDAVCPDAVSKGETENDMWGVDYSKLVPLMLKEIQSLRARVAELENK